MKTVESLEQTISLARQSIHGKYPHPSWDLDFIGLDIKRRIVSQKVNSMHTLLQIYFPIISRFA